MTSEADPTLSSANCPPAAPAWCWFRLDAQGQLVEAGPALEVLTGIPLQNWRQQPKPFSNSILEADREAYLLHLRQSAAVATGSASTCRLRHASSQRIFTIQEFRKPTLSQTGKLEGFQGLLLDFSRPQIFENRLAAGAWSQTLGVLIPGLIHEFNNTLATILSLSDLFLGQIDAAHPFYEGLNAMKQNTQVAGQRLQRLHSLHRSTPGSRCYLDLNEVTRDLVDLLKRALRRHTELELVTASGTLPVYADPVQLQQTIIQLSLNAMEAMPEGGRIRFITKLWNHLPQVVNSLRLPVVTVAIEDTGPGLTAAEMRAIFDPTFTTKPDRAGAGLGLYHARLFAQSHHGTVTVESRPGFGSTFTLWLPQADFSEAEEAAAGPQLTRS